MSGAMPTGACGAGVQVDLWCVELGTGIDGADLALLSQGERARAARFASDRDRNRFVAARAALRRVLATYVGLRAAALDFVSDALGRPRIEGAHGFDFNLSHSDTLALIGVTSSGPIGVDVEMVRRVADGALLAERFFSRAEAAALCALAPARRDRGFLTCWTRKEACLKAIGTGLTTETRGVEVGIEATARRVALSSERGSVELIVRGCDFRSDAIAAIATTASAEARVFERHCAELR
jgi:4'-phosphopantetheinyl transferase